MDRPIETFAYHADFLRSLDLAVGKDRVLRGFPRSGQPDIRGLSVDPSLLEPQGNCSVPISGTTSVPVLLRLEVLAPYLDPAMWGRFDRLKVTQPHVANPHCPDGGTGWAGSLVEEMNFKLCGTDLYAFENQLNIVFCYSSLLMAFSRAEWTLGECFEGGFTYDAGHFSAVALDDHLSSLECKKAINFAPDTVFCRVPVDILEWMLRCFLKVSILEYAFRVVAYVAACGTPEEQKGLGDGYEGFVRRLREIGYDIDAAPSEAVLLPHFFES